MRFAERYGNDGTLKTLKQNAPDPEVDPVKTEICPRCGASGGAGSAGCAKRCFTKDDPSEDGTEDIQKTPQTPEQKMGKKRDDLLKEYFS